MDDHGGDLTRHPSPWIGGRVPFRKLVRAAAEQRRHRATVKIELVRLGQVGDRRQREYAAAPGPVRLRRVPEGELPASGVTEQDRRPRRQLR